MDRKFSSLDDLDEDFLLVQPKTGKSQDQVTSKLSPPDPASEQTPGLSPGKKSLSLPSLALGHLPQGHCRIRTYSVGRHGQGSSQEPQGALGALLQPLKNDDLELFKTLLAELSQNGLSLADKSLHSEDGSNILHLAIEMDSTTICEHLIESSKTQLLVEYFYSTSLTHRTTALHLLVQKNHFELTKLLLAKVISLSESSQQEFYKSLTPVTMDDRRVHLMTALHLAAIKGNTALVRLLTDAGIPVDVVNEARETPLMWAVLADHLETVKVLVHLGAGANQEDDKGSTPLYWATRCGHTDILHFLLTEGKANVNHRRRFGYILPLVLAASVGHAQIVLELLKYGAKVNAKVTGGKVALHHAASQGHDNIVCTLLQYGAKINMADDAGNTPLMLATKERHSQVIQTLLAKGADMSRKNKMGQTVWDFLMDTPGTALLSMYVSIYKLVNNITSPMIFRFERGRTPLHIAALKDDTSKVRCLLRLNADWRCPDDMGNTFLHTAAKENCTQVLHEFAVEYDMCFPNEHGETPLHIAVKYGHMDAATAMLSRTSLSATNKRGSTPLHIAAWSPHSNRDIVKTLVETAVTSNSWSLLDSQDSKGNTALHIAAKKGRTDIIEELQALDPRVTNRDGNNPLHIAAMSGGATVLECLLEVFGSSPDEEYPDATFQRYELDQENGCGDTLLHICTRVGDVEGVQRLVKGGASMELKNNLGNTVLHDLVEQSVKAPSRKELYLQVYHLIVQLAPVWWCKRKGAVFPDEDSPLLVEYQRTAMLFLTSDILNEEGRCVLKHCVAVGATNMMEAILNTPNVYCMVTYNKQVSYDITNLTPDTELEGVKTRLRMNRESTVSVLKEMNDKRLTQESCLDIIIGLKNEVHATKMLDISPIKQLVKNYWAAYQLVYGFSMISHIIFMSFYTKFSVQSIATAPEVVNRSSADSIQTYYTEQDPHMWPTILLLIWPTCIMLFDLYYIASNRQRRQNRGSKVTGSQSKVGYLECSAIPSRILSSVLDFGTHFAGILFALSVYTWFGFYEFSSDLQNYILSVALMFGWMFTISFAKGFETVHSFSIILKHILLRDITRFLFIYCFAMFGFALAFHVMFQMVPPFARTYKSPWDTFFMTLNVMLGLEDSLFEDFESSYNSAVNFIKVIYVFYVLFSSIILLNLLIAMMTDSYAHVISREGTTWRLGSVKLALKLERSFPFLKTIFKKVGIIKNTVTFDPVGQRWMMTFRRSDILAPMTEDVKDESSVLRGMEQRVVELQTTCLTINRQMDSLMKCMELINEANGNVGFARGSLRYRSSKGKRSALMSTVQKWRESASLHRRLSNEHLSNTDARLAVTKPSSEVSNPVQVENKNALHTESLRRVISHWKGRSQKRTATSSTSSASSPGRCHLEQVPEEGEVNLTFTPEDDLPTEIK